MEKRLAGWTFGFQRMTDKGPVGLLRRRSLGKRLGVKLHENTSKSKVLPRAWFAKILEFAPLRFALRQQSRNGYI